jgi:hypothetical protein
MITDAIVNVRVILCRRLVALSHHPLALVVLVATKSCGDFEAHLPRARNRRDFIIIF